MKFRKKPVVIEARQFIGDEKVTGEILMWVNEGQIKNGKKPAAWVNGALLIPTLEGEHIASPGDWIICGIAGEFYPCKPDIFEATYEAVE